MSDRFAGWRKMRPPMPTEWLTTQSTDEEMIDWLERVAGYIGGGFHPDESADSYDPPLPPELAVNFDHNRQITWDRFGEDVYTYSSNGWRKYGLAWLADFESEHNADTKGTSNDLP